MGSDQAFMSALDQHAVFQSTLPGWGATRMSNGSMCLTLKFQSTLPGWGATA